METKPEQINYNAFVDHDDMRPTNENLKVDASKSMFSKKQFSKKQKPPSKEDFQQEVSEHIANKNEMFKEVQAATKQYWGLIKSKILPENKEQPHIDLEQQAISALINLSMKLNNDQSLQEGIGSVGLCQLLLQICLHQRDQINALSYRVKQLEDSLSK